MVETPIANVSQPKSTDNQSQDGEEVIENLIEATEEHEGSYDVVRRCTRTGCDYEERNHVVTPVLPKKLPQSGGLAVSVLLPALFGGLAFATGGTCMIIARKKKEDEEE